MASPLLPSALGQGRRAHFAFYVSARGGATIHEDLGETQSVDRGTRKPADGQLGPAVFDRTRVLAKRVFHCPTKESKAGGKPMKRLTELAVVAALAISFPALAHDP